ncbi:3-phosphoshikimate 1-carboxyvinyltransferase [Gracilibacillus halotolerans]|uniref:3-phosphoshikimate 1-carboxyvinyltransferase n=1 Tax=Gracilibacillus halotolerans TaxID=74386 RepID=A0A841RKC3_9BACI|nr:3-phosphoshikimate 1-carboxyvinyltransferase [Gracilibacillus halotolerans]MBB6511645.1 3-phosphoshikimate 1-carboxyvinyltransferase [Gracilibacillus halotolerans]
MVETKQLDYGKQSLQGSIAVPGDKSISHRAVMFGSLASGETKITNFLAGEDCIRTIDAFKAMGVNITRDEQTVIVKSTGVAGLKEPVIPINLGNSGTTARLLMGILAGLPFHFTLFGDDSLSNRPMDRITIPLKQMGAKIDGRDSGRLLPISLRGGNLKPIDYQTPMKSAQVKSGVLLAGLMTDGTTTVVEESKTRDHTENMLKAFGAEIESEGTTVRITGNQPLQACNIEVPGDISSAAFFLAGAAIIPGSHITIKDVGLNPTRSGIIDVLKMMSIDIEATVTRTVGGEPIGDVSVKYSQAKGTTIEGEIIPRIIDEIPIIALVASQAKGTTIIKDAEELKFKETDRIEAVVTTLKTLGVNIVPTDDGMVVEGGASIKGANVHSYGDHRIGMMIAIASLLTEDRVELENPSCINISYPQFFTDLEKLFHS